jgi:hypothetical protein
MQEILSDAADGVPSKNPYWQGKLPEDAGAGRDDPQ